MIFDASVDSVVSKEGDGLSPKETVCEIFDLSERHFFLFLGIVLLYPPGGKLARVRLLRLFQNILSDVFLFRHQDTRL